MNIEELKTIYPTLIAQIEQEARSGNNGETKDITITKDQDNNILSWTEITRCRDGHFLSRRWDQYTYLNGVVDTIIQKTFIGLRKTEDITVKHTNNHSGITVTDNLITNPVI